MSQWIGEQMFVWLCRLLLRFIGVSVSVVGVLAALSNLFPMQAFAKQFNSTPDDLDMHMIYDVSHNIAKIEARESLPPSHCSCGWRVGAMMTTLRWRRSIWLTASRRSCWCTERAPRAPSHRTTR